MLVAEGGIAAGVKIGQSFSLRAGYRVLFIDDIATAPALIDQVDVLNASIGESRDEILIHGVTIGGKFVF